jgi:hypothetical protein
LSEEISKWLSSLEGYSFSGIEQINSDASFRNYFRVIDDRRGSFIVMDSDPSLENNEKFLHASDLLQKISMPIPNIYHIDDCGRYFLISDLGKKTLFDRRRESHFLSFYDRAIELLVSMQINGASLKSQLPNYDNALLYSEMELFKEWFCFHELGLSVQEIEKIDFDPLFTELIQSANNQERVLVHRDYHSRNIMISDNDEMGFVDFQDAVSGPITYDIVSLLRDCYVKIEREQVNNMLRIYYGHLIKNHMMSKTLSEFIMDFDLMGIQRHLKAIGIFSRLKHRDKKNNYINDIPLTMSYLKHLSNQYESLENMLIQLKLK